ncbi:MAG: lysoplasmalogenase, partial [Lapillicoccus sp.]
WLLHAEQSVSGIWLLMGLALCLLGDWLLLSESDQAFGFGLVTFLLGHVAFIGAVLTMNRRPPVWAGVVATLVVVMLIVAFVLWPMARQDMAEGLPPTIYALVLGGFVAAAWWSGHLLIGVGASLFFASDALLAARRFWREIPGSGVVVMVTYHVALLFLVVGVLRPDLVGT